MDCHDNIQIKKYMARIGSHSVKLSRKDQWSEYREKKKKKKKKAQESLVISSGQLESIYDVIITS